MLNTILERADAHVRDAKCLRALYPSSDATEGVNLVAEMAGYIRALQYALDVRSGLPVAHAKPVVEVERKIYCEACRDEGDCPVCEDPPAKSRNYGEAIVAERDEWHPDDRVTIPGLVIDDPDTLSDFQIDAILGEDDDGVLTRLPDGSARYTHGRLNIRHAADLAEARS